MKTIQTSAKIQLIVNKMNRLLKLRDMWERKAAENVFEPMYSQRALQADGAIADFEDDCKLFGLRFEFRNDRVNIIWTEEDGIVWQEGE